jgi:hypothetical protein
MSTASMTMNTLILTGTSTNMNMSTRMGRGFITERNTSTGIRIHMFTRIRIPTRETANTSMKRRQGEWWKCGRRFLARTIGWQNAIVAFSGHVGFLF